MTMSSAVGSSSGPIPNFQQSYPPPIPSSPPRFPGTASPAAGYRRRPSTDELNSSQYYGIHHRDRRESASHGWKSPLTATSNSGGGHFTGPERPQRQRPGEKWPYRHNTLPWPSVPPRVSPEGTQVVSSSGRPYPSGRSFTFDEADVRRRDRLLESSPPRAPQSQPAPAVTAGAISTSPRHSNLPPSLAGLVLDPSVDTRLGDAPTVLSPINILAAKDLEPESPPRRSSYQHGHYSRKDESEERQSSSSGSPHDRPNQPAIPSIARLLN